jgi:hypothetical protein
MPRLVAGDLTLEEFEELKSFTNVKSKDLWPEGSASVLSQLSFSYLGPLLSLGAKQGRTLSPTDLFEIPKEDVSSFLSKKFRGNFNACGGAEEMEGDEAGFWRLVWGLWHLVRDIMMEAGWCNFVACSMQVVMPLLLRELVLAVAEPDPEVARRRGLEGAAWVAAVCLTHTLTQQRQQHLANRAGMHMRACLISEIFDTLTPKVVWG